LPPDAVFTTLATVAQRPHGARTCGNVPALEKEGRVSGRDELTANTEPINVIRHLLPRGADLMQVRNVVEALCALRDVGA